MSLFYGFKSKEEELEERMRKLEIQLPVQFPFHRHNITFDFNVTRASKNTTFLKSKPEYVSNIIDRDGESKQVSVIYYYGLVNPAILNTSGKHHFLSPKNGEKASMYINCPKIRVPNVSIFIVMKRNNKPKGITNELIFRNASKGIRYSSGSTPGYLIIGAGVSPYLHYFKAISVGLNKKHLLSIHYRSEYKESCLYVNNSLITTFLSSIGKNEDTNTYIFGGREEHKNHSDISIYEIKMLEGYLTKEEIEENIAEIIARNEIK